MTILVYIIAQVIIKNASAPISQQLRHIAIITPREEIIK